MQTTAIVDRFCSSGSVVCAKCIFSGAVQSFAYPIPGTEEYVPVPVSGGALLRQATSTVLYSVLVS